MKGKLVKKGTLNQVGTHLLALCINFSTVYKLVQHLWHGANKLSSFVF